MLLQANSRRAWSKLGVGPSAADRRQAGRRPDPRKNMVQAMSRLFLGKLLDSRRTELQPKPIGGRTLSPATGEAGPLATSKKTITNKRRIGWRSPCRLTEVPWSLASHRLPRLGCPPRPRRRSPGTAAGAWRLFELDLEASRHRLTPTHPEKWKTRETKQMFGVLLFSCLKCQAREKDRP